MKLPCVLLSPFSTSFNGCRARLAAVLLGLGALTFQPQPVQAAVIEAWVHRYSNVVSNSADQASKVVTDAAGDIIVTGATYDFISSDMLTIKYSGADGSVLWQHRYNGLANGAAFASALAVDGSGNVVVTGSSRNDREDYDYYTAKYAAADGALIWEKRYSGPAGGDDLVRAVAVDGSGNVVVTGSSGTGGPNWDADYYTAKYAAADGALLWAKRYNGPANRFDYASALALDDSGNVVVTGSSYNGTNSDFYTAKYAAVDGALLWAKHYNGPANRDDFASAVVVDGSGNVVVSGFSYGTGDYFDYYTAKYAADGELLWEERYNGPGGARTVAVDASGNVVVTGASGGDYYTAKYAAADGALLWEKRYNSPAGGNDQAQAMAVDGSGNVVVTGFSETGGPNWDADYYTAKYAAGDGALLWEKRYNSLAGGNDQAQAMAVDGSGNVVVAGVSHNPMNDNASDGDYYTAKYAAADGALLWEKRYNGPANGPANREDRAQAIAVDASGNVVVTGDSISDSGNSDYYTAKYAAADGALVWAKRYLSPSGNIEPARAIVVVDGTGNVVVTGSSINYHVNENLDYYTAKYAAADGALLWEKRYDGPGNRNDEARALAVDGSGNVVVTGASAGNDFGSDYYTAKYAAADGTLLWEKRYHGPENFSSDSAQAVVVDRSGNVIVTGASGGDYYTAKYGAADGALLWEKRGPSVVVIGWDRSSLPPVIAVDRSGNVVLSGASPNERGDSDYYTTKYAAGDGALLWEKRYDGPANLWDFASAVAVDASDNVVVAGSSAKSGSWPGFIYDCYTAKYAAGDGALLWEKRYNGLGDGNDEARSVAVDDSGNVVVTGNSNNGTNNDYYTAKYAATDGALLWEKRYNGPVNGNDFVGGSRSLALGPKGMVAITGYSADTFNFGIAYAYATVVYREALPPVSVELVATGVRLRFTGTGGQSYSIQRAFAISGPWSAINTQTASASGLVEYLDTSPHPGSGFYRTVQP